MKKLIHRPVEDDQKVFFENEEQFSDWVSCKESGGGSMKNKWLSLGCIKSLPIGKQETMRNPSLNKNLVSVERIGNLASTMTRLVLGFVT